MIYYIILALSYSLSTLYFIHIKGLKEHGIKVDFLSSILYIIMAFIFFPFFIIPFIVDHTRFKKIYSEALVEELTK